MQTIENIPKNPEHVDNVPKRPENPDCNVQKVYPKFRHVPVWLYRGADDNTPYAIDMTLGGLMEKLESASNCALEWFCVNGMKPNSSKCHLLICGH